MFSLERDLNCNAAGLGAKGAREVCIHFKVGCHFSTVVRDALDRNFILQTMNHDHIQSVILHLKQRDRFVIQKVTISQLFDRDAQAVFLQVCHFFSRNFITISYLIIIG